MTHYVDMIYSRKSCTSMPFWQWSNYRFSETLYQHTKFNWQNFTNTTYNKVRCMCYKA